MKKMKNKGFTLIELLVVVLIIGILSAIAVPKYQLAVEKSRAAEAFTILKAIKQAEDVYFLSNPKDSAPTLEKLDIDIPGEKVSGRYSVRKTKDFEIGFHWNTNISPHARRVDSERNQLYYLAYYYDLPQPGFYCNLSTNKSQFYMKVCKSLGGVSDNVCSEGCMNDPEICKDTCFRLQ